MIRNQSTTSSTSPLGHTLSKPINSTISSKQYSSQISYQQPSKLSQAPGSSHGPPSAINENLNIANQKSLNGENMVSGPLPKPNVKILDLQHNLLPFDSGIQGVTHLAGTGAGGIATSTGQ